MREHGQITSAEARLHTGDRPLAEEERIVTREMIVEPGDRFVAMELDDLGGLTIWTEERVWCTRYTGGDRERLVQVRRSVPVERSSMLSREWQDFIIYPLDSTRVRSRAERVDLSPREGAVVCPRSTILRWEDVFEGMEIGEHGQVTIWTRDKVWFLATDGNEDRIEKLRFLPRHPPTPDGNESRQTIASDYQ